MFNENFQYCDPPTIKDESIRSQVDRMQKKELRLREYHDVAIYPWTEETEPFQGEVMNRDGSVVPNVNMTSYYENHIGKTYDLPDIEDEVEEAIYLGNVAICWGHYFTDGIAKMWCIDNPRFQELLSRDVPVYFVAPYYPMYSTPKAWEHLLQKLGFTKHVLPLLKPTRFHKLHVADSSLYIENKTRYFTPEYKTTVERLVANSIVHQDTPTYDKLYLSRLKLKRKAKEYGERAIQRAFQKQGYHVIYPETLSYEEQVWLYSHAKSIVATKGSICMNSIFCQPGTELIVLRKSFGTHDYQYIISQVRDLNVTHIDSHLTVFITEMPSIGPFFIYINDNLVRFFKDRFNKTLRNNFSRTRFFAYALYAMQKKDFRERTKSPSYYYDKMYDELNKRPSYLYKLIRKMVTVL